jgi:hypothetical protein
VPVTSQALAVRGKFCCHRHGGRSPSPRTDKCRVRAARTIQECFGVEGRTWNCYTLNMLRRFRLPSPSGC